MSEDLTKKPGTNDSDLLTLILTIVKKLEKHETILNQIVDRLGNLTSRVEAMESRLNVMETRLDAIESRLNVMEKRLDVMETRLNVMDGRLDAIEARLQSMEQTIKRSVHSLGRGQTVLNDAILKIHIGLIDIDERLQGVEPHRKPTNSQT